MTIAWPRLVQAHLRYEIWSESAQLNSLSLCFKYIRLYFGKSFRTLHRIFDEIWGLELPKLAILVIGEAGFDSLESIDTIVETAYSTSNCKLSLSHLYQ